MILSIICILSVIAFWFFVGYWVKCVVEYDTHYLPDDIEHCLIEIEDTVESYACYDRICELTEQIRKLEEKKNENS